MNFKMVHNNLNVLNLKRSMDFYEKALGLKEASRIDPGDGSFVIVYLTDGESPHKLELTWLPGRKEPYDLGDNEIHLCFETNDYKNALRYHKEMDCVCYENEAMGIYFISDPDGYWLEIIPKDHIPPISAT